MDITTGIPDHIEDYLVRLYPNQWFTWTDSKNKVYANLRLTTEYGVKGNMVSNPRSLPTEKECTDGLKALQTAHDDAKTKFESDKTSANNKLKALGLTDDEITAITKG